MFLDKQGVFFRYTSRSLDKQSVSRHTGGQYIYRVFLDIQAVPEHLQNHLMYKHIYRIVDVVGVSLDIYRNVKRVS